MLKSKSSQYIQILKHLHLLIKCKYEVAGILKGFYLDRIV